MGFGEKARAQILAQLAAIGLAEASEAIDEDE
jgi:hypothetical protein